MANWTEGIGMFLLLLLFLAVIAFLGAAFIVFVVFFLKLFGVMA